MSNRIHANPEVAAPARDQIKFDASCDFADVAGVMSEKAKKTSGAFEYPDETSGSKAATRLRSATNNLTDAQRESLLQRGMQIIYGGTGKKTVRAGR